MSCRRNTSTPSKKPSLNELESLRVFQSQRTQMEEEIRRLDETLLLQRQVHEETMEQYDECLKVNAGLVCRIDSPSACSSTNSRGIARGPICSASGAAAHTDHVAPLRALITKLNQVPRR
jgi:hypothetical protein